MGMVQVHEQESWSTRPWGVADLDAFQDDVRREVLHGELLVTPAPAPRHALLVARLVTLLSHYCDRERAGVVLAPGVVRWSDNQLEPDIAVFPHGTPIDVPWSAFPRPLLVIEVHSPSTAHIDRTVKRDAYGTLGIPEYWQVVPDDGVVAVCTPHADDLIVHDTVRWSPPSSKGPSPLLQLPVAQLLG